MKTVIEKCVPAGAVCAPPSKSMMHRVLLCAALSGGVSRIENPARCADTVATLGALEELGAAFKTENGVLTVTGIGMPPEIRVPSRTFSCKESASTLRFFLPVSLLYAEKNQLRGEAGLLRRPLGEFGAAFQNQEVEYCVSETAVTVSGTLRSGVFSLSGDVSSQYLSGLLFALPLLSGESTVILSAKPCSKPYTDMTLAVLRDFGIRIISESDTRFRVPGNQVYRAHDVKIEGDWSGAASLAALGVAGGRVTVLGLNEESLQGDKVFRSMFSFLQGGTPTLDLTDCPDLAPVLFAVAAACQGADFLGTERLRGKECDRVAAMCAELEKFGVALSVQPDAVTVPRMALCAPRTPLSAHGDHRIAMALCVLCTLTGGTIAGSESVDKSFPGFWDALRELGVPFRHIQE